MKKKLQKLSLDKFNISRLNTKSSDRVLGGNTMNTLAPSVPTQNNQSTQPNCHTIPEICTIEGNTIHVNIISNLCPPPTNNGQN